MKATFKSTGGTSFHDSVISETLANLISVLGEPNYSGNDGEDKVNFEWEMETEDGTVFTVYDWKEYRSISDHEVIEWHIGGKSRSDTEKARQEIFNALFNKK
jgi:hypothetical protein